MAVKKIANPEYVEQEKALKRLEAKVQAAKVKASSLGAKVKALESTLQTTQNQIEKANEVYTEALEAVDSLYEGIDEARGELRGMPKTIEA